MCILKIINVTLIIPEIPIFIVLNIEYHVLNILYDF